MTTAQTHHHRRSRRVPTGLWRTTVARTRQITPRLRRITLVADELREFVSSGSDSHVLLYLYPPGCALPEPLTAASARAAFSRIRPQMRSYTVRHFDPAAGELDIDFVLHADPGPASAWAGSARQGDELIIVGPSPAYDPDPDAAQYVLIGDESALPAIEVILSELRAGSRARVFAEVADAGEEVTLHSAAELDVRWCHRNAERPGESEVLLEEVRARSAGFADGADVWIAGERGTVAALRAHLLTERGLPRARVRPTSYWRLGQAGG